MILYIRLRWDLLKACRLSLLQLLLIVKSLHFRGVDFTKVFWHQLVGQVNRCLRLVRQSLLFLLIDLLNIFGFGG